MNDQIHYDINETCNSTDTPSSERLRVYIELSKADNRMIIGSPCATCGYELMRISKENLQKCMRSTHEFRSIPKKLLRKKLLFTSICPHCDAYALGLDMSEAIPIQDKNGKIMSVHDLQIFK